MHSGTAGRRVLVTGGGGYVGSRLVGALIEAGYSVSVLDTFWYGAGVLSDHERNRELKILRGDIRNRDDVSLALNDVTDVIHLACISNDPSYDLDPDFGRSINLEAFPALVKLSRDSGVRRFVFASSSSVYGIKSEENVTEDLTLAPLTDYSRFKAECEEIILNERQPGFTATVLRPATVCGPSRRQRMDLAVNLLTNHAVCRGEIKVFGGEQYRPNIHIADMVSAYLKILSETDDAVDGEVFNVGGENIKVRDLAQLVSELVESTARIVTEPSDDMRSYRISSEKILRKLDFAPQRGVRDAVTDLVSWFQKNRFPNSLSDSRYFNILRMQEILDAAGK